VVSYVGDVNEIEHASPLKGEMKDWFADPPAIVPPVVMAPLLGLSHSTFSVRVVADRFTVNVPPLGAYTRYSATR